MLMSELGGFIKLVHVMLNTLIFPVAQYLFFIVMIKRLYFAKTESDGVFQQENKN